MPIANTIRNKQRRMAKHAKRYPQKSTKSTAQRRAMGKAWKQEAGFRAAEADRKSRDQSRARLLGPELAAQITTL